jgi:hypothetical protein
MFPGRRSGTTYDTDPGAMRPDAILQSAGPSHPWAFGSDLIVVSYKLFVGLARRFSCLICAICKNAFRNSKRTCLAKPER